MHTLLVFTSIYRLYLSVFTEFHRFLGKLGFWGHVEILTQVPAWGGNPPPPPCGCPGYPLPCLGVIKPPPWFALRRGVKRYPGPHGP